MKLVSFSTTTESPEIRLGALHNNVVIDLHKAYDSLVSDTNDAEKIRDSFPADMLALFAAGESAMSNAKRAVDFATNLDNASTIRAKEISHAIDDVKLHAPVIKPNSIRDTISFETHAKNFEKRSGKPTPALWYEQPIYYKGNTSTVVGHGDPIIWPSYTEKLDYELEFGIYIGKPGKNIKAEDAHKHIAGYTIFNDISARDVLQKEIKMMLGPAKGKDMDNGNVMGPCVVTPDEIDASNLEMFARINGEEWSRGNSSDMYWSFDQIIEFISKSETLHTGDFIGSGTIAFGCGDELERWIQPGDVIELEVEGIGILTNTVERE